MVARQWAAGDVLAEKYRLVSELGRGGMGAVWRAEHLVLRSDVAVKLVLTAVATSEPLRARFLREAQAAAALRSPHVVQILDYGVHEDTPFMVMELLEGESLRQRLSRVGVLSPEETARVVVHVARALVKAQEAGIVHRDLKPDNVFLVHNADEDIAKVLDFGIAKAMTETSVGAETQSGAVLGTAYYMSPEQARGTRSVDHRTDLWALGVIAFECLTGRRPFDGAVLGDVLVKICSEPLPVPSTLAPVPPGFDAWFERALARDPDRRFTSGSEMADAFRALLGPGRASFAPPSAVVTAPIGPVSVAPASLPAPPSIARPASKPASPLVVAVVALLGVGAVGALGAAAYLWQQRGVGAAAPSASTLAAPLAASGVELLDAVDGGAGPRSTKRAGAAKPTAGDAGPEWMNEVKKAQKAQEDAEKAKAAAEALKQKWGANQ
ncbi:MAG: protein kinase [Polyangiaceae bacterium]|nr:protein kinase [Polyangiaceae bacterium]